MIQILALYLDFDGAKNIHVLQVLIWGFGILNIEYCLFPIHSIAAISDLKITYRVKISAP